jgi:CBS-domain-containing membrane protein
MEGAAVQARDAMTRDVVTVGPDSFVKDAAEVMAERGFAALPVVDGENRLVGIVAEADVLRDRLPPDPRLHLRRDEPSTQSVPALLVRDVMTAGVRSVEASADVAAVARMFVEQHLRSVPVLEHGRTVGIVTRPARTTAFGPTCCGSWRTTPARWAAGTSRSARAWRPSGGPTELPRARRASRSTRSRNSLPPSSAS